MTEGRATSSGAKALTCVVAGEIDEVDRIVELFQSLDCFASVAPCYNTADSGHLLDTCDVLVMPDREWEFYYIGWTGTFPWILTWSPPGSFLHVPKERILVVPQCRYSGDPKFAQHFLKMISQLELVPSQVRKHPEG